MAKATKLPSGTWQCRVWDKYQKKNVCFTSDTQKEAERQANLYKLTLKPSSTSSLTFGEAAEIYIKSKNKILSPNTIKDYTVSLKYHVYSLKDRPINKIDDIAIQMLVNDLATELAPKSVKNVYGFITAVIRSVDPHKTFSVTLPRKIKQDIKIPSEADIRLIMDTIKGTDLEIPVCMAIYCCLRRGEICSIINKKECIGKNSVTVKYNMIKSGNNWVYKSPKTFTSYRTVFCPEWLTERIKKAPEINPGTVTDHWIKLMKKMGMDYTFHQLRHFAATAMMSTGQIPLVDIERIGGWRHGSTVLQEIYTHNIDESMHRSADIWSEKIEKFASNLH